MKTLNLRHAGIVVGDMDRSLSFYKDLIGFEIVKDQVEEGRYIDIFLGLEDVKVRTVKMILGEGSMLELLQFYSHVGAKNKGKLYDLGCTHIAITVDNLDDTYKGLLNHGTTFVNEPEISPDGLAKVVFCKDPDGTFIEIVEEIK
jgi:lactoylglutathione lyase